MARLIDADALVEDIRNHSESYFADDFAHEWVNKQPTVDAVPVRHGKWKKIRGAINCSACKRSSWSMSFEDLVTSFNYCPNCGAKIDKE